MPSPDVPRPDRRLVDVDLVRRLVARQLPRWADLPVRPVAVSGWDNQTFRLGDHLSVRLPTAREYALAVEKEQRWLPHLAPHLPLQVPEPVAHGEPDDEFAHPWSVYAWIEGEPATSADARDPIGFARTLGAFLVALRQVDATGGPPPGLHSWFRGGPLDVYDEQTRRFLDALDALVPRRAATEVWERALASTWDGPPVWFHGDVAPGNLLVRDGDLAAVIDFGTCGVGDPACDLVIAWTVLTGESREAFRAAVDADRETWARARGWALWKALLVWSGSVGRDPAAAADSRRVVEAVLAG